MRLRDMAPLALVVALGSTASAETPIRRYEYLDWTTTAKWEHSGHAQAGTAVIRNAVDYAAFFGGHPPATPAVDWSKEEVLAVALGTTTNGDWVEVLRLDRALSGPDAGSTLVRYAVRHRTPTGTTTTPFHVLKVIKGSTRYGFSTGPFSPYDQAALAAWDAGSHGGLGTPIEPQTVARLQGSSTPPSGPYVPLTAGPPAPVLAGPFDSLLLSWEGGLSPNSQTITISKTGALTLNRYGSPNQFLTGQTSTPELQAVIGAYTTADVGTLPASIPRSSAFFDRPSLRIVATAAGRDVRVVVGEAGSYGSFAARLRPLVDAVQAIMDRLDRVAQQPSTFTGVVEPTQTGLTVGSFAVGRSSPLYNVLAGSWSRNATVNLVGTTVVSVVGRAKVALTVAPSAGSRQVTDRFADGESVTILGATRDWSGAGWYRVATHANGTGYVGAALVDASAPIGPPP